MIKRCKLFRKVIRLGRRELRKHIRRFRNWFGRIKALAEGGISTTEIVNMVCSFCEMYTGMKYYVYQQQYAKRIIRSVLENDGAEITALFARQMGKTQTTVNTVGGMMIILPQLANMPMFANDKRLEMFKNGLWVGLFAPSLQQSQNAYGRLKNGLQSDYAIPILEEFGYEFLTSNGERVSLSNGSYCTARSASDNANIEGDSYKLILCEECQDIGTFKLRKSIHPMGAAYNATLVKIGTATTFKGDFLEAIERNKKDYAEGKLRIRNHFEYNGLVGAKYNEKYAKYLAKEKYRLGEDSDEFRMSYMLEWILERGMFIDIDLLEKNCGIIEADRVAYDKTSYCVAGIDLAKRDDKTVITVVKVDWDNPSINEENKASVSGLDEGFVAYETMVLDWKELTGDDYEQQYYEIMDYLSNFNIKRVMIDGTKEEGMCDRLRANYGDKIDVVTCIFSSGFKSDMYKHLDTEIKAKRCKFPLSKETKQSREYQKFSQEMGDLEKDYRGQTLVVSHPNVRGAHDDYADSWALAVYGTKYQTENDVIETEKSNKLYQSHYQQQNVFMSSRNRLTARRR